VLREYSMNSVTQGIDAIATTRVVIGGDSSISPKHTLEGATFSRTFRSFSYILIFFKQKKRAFLLFMHL
jgi:2-isopropylmalate synthase